jgi:hypothetical protein
MGLPAGRYSASTTRLSLKTRARDTRDFVQRLDCHFGVPLWVVAFEAQNLVPERSKPTQGGYICNLGAV